MRAVLLAAALVAVAAPAAAQPESPSAAMESYRRARLVLDAGIAAIGGEAALRDLGIVRRRMTFDYVDAGQQRRAVAPDAGLDRLPVSVRSGVEVWADYRDARFARIERFDDGPGDWFVQRDAGDAAGGFGAGHFRGEADFFAVHSAEDFAALRARELLYFPEALLREALARPENLQWVARSGEVEILSFATARGQQLRLHFDSATHHLVRTEYLRDHPLLGDTIAELRFEDFRRVGPLTLPFRFHTRLGGRPSRVFAVAAIDFPAAWDEGLLQPPERRVAIVEPPPEAQLQDLGHGVYAVLGPYNVMFAEFRDFVLLAEAPVDAAFAASLYRLIGTVAPGKPVRVVATHFHSDHLGGLPYAVAQGSPVWAAADVRPALEMALASRRTLRPPPAGTTGATLDFHAVAGRAVFDDGTQRVEVYDVGPTPHAEHMLVVAFPRAQTVLVADLWDILSPELALGGRDAEVLMHRLRASGVAFERMVPVHGVPATRAQLERGLAIRARYVPPLDVDAWTREQVGPVR